MQRLNRTLTAIVGLALLLRTGWLLYSQPVPVADMAEYLRLAASLLRDGCFCDPAPTAYRLPGYPAFLAVLLSAGSSRLWLGFAHVLLSTALVPLAAATAKSLAPETSRAPAWAALLCALNPTFVFASPLLLSEHLLLPLLFAALLLLLRESARPLLAALGAGICLGAASLTRGEALFYLPVFAAAGVFAARGTRRLLRPAIVAGVAVLMLVPWAARNRSAIGPGAGLSTSGGVNFYYAHNRESYGWHPIEQSPLAGLDELERNRRGYEIGRAVLAEESWGERARDAWTGTRALFFTGGHYSIFWSTRADKNPAIGEFPGRDLRGLRFLNATISPFYVALLPPVALSLLFIRRRLSQTLLSLAGLVLMNWVCYALVFWGKARYRFVSEFVFCIVAAASIAELCRHIGARGRERRV